MGVTIGVTIEQYRARIGAHDNVRIKIDSTQLEGNFCDTNVDVISVGNNNYDINYSVILMLIFFPECNLIFADKEVVITIKSFSQVIVSFTQMSCYNV